MSDATTNRGVAIRVTGRAPAAPDVRQVAMPAAARALTTLSRVDYSDAFSVPMDAAEARTGEQWARVILEDAPLISRRALRSAWFALGIKLGSTRSDRLVLGWTMRRSTPDLVLLTAGSRLGLKGEILVERAESFLLVATFVQLDNPIALAVWTGVAPGHRRAVRHLIGQANGRTGGRERDG